MKEIKSKQRIVGIAVILFSLIALIAGFFIARRSEPKEHNPYYTIEYELARVKKVINNNYTVDEDSEHAIRGSQSLDLELMTGRHKGESMPVMNYLGPMHEKLAKAGTVLTVMLTEDSREAGYQLSIVNYNYIWLYAVLIALFVIAVAFVGRWKGVKSLIALLYSLLAIILFLIPMWLKGHSAILLTLITSVFITAFGFTLIGGASKKTLAALIGTLLCVLISAGIAALAGAAAKVSGLTMEEAEWLLDESRTIENTTLNVRGLLVSGIIISSLGAVMDVAMSIASAVCEINAVDPSLTRKKLFASGMNIGRDMIGTMTNTLILAFMGSSLNLVIIMSASGMQLYQLLNNNDTMMEVIRSIAGSLGLVLAVPVTAFAASLLIKASGRKNTVK